MKTIFKGSGLALGLAALLMAQPARGITGGETAIIAGATAAVALGVPLVSQAMTYSWIDVKVEAFMETERLTTNELMKIYGSELYWRTNSPERRRTEPFKLGGAAAIKNMKDAAANNQPSQILSTAYHLSEERVGLDTTIQFLESSITLLKTFNNSKGMSEVAADFDVRLQAAKKLRADIDSYVALAQKVPANGAVPLELSTAAANTIGLIRLDADKCQQPFDVATQDLILAQIQGVMAASVSLPDKAPLALPNDEGLTPQAKTVMGAVSQAVKAGGDKLTGDAQIALYVFNALQMIRTAESKEGVVKLGTNSAVFADTKALGDGLVQVLNTFGYRVTATSTAMPGSLALTSLKNSANFKEVQRKLTPIFVVTQLASDSQGVVIATYAGLTVGSNVGPVVNEAFQEVFSRSKVIDAILSEKGKWKTVNYAYSKSHAGDHNAVIYFDNNLTPVLKTATFDPSEIIAANAQLYIRVANAMSSIYGIPSATPGDGTKVNTNYFGDLNLYSQQARKQNAQEASDKDRQELIKALKTLVTAGNTIKSNTKDADTWNGGDDTAIAATATAQLTTLTNTMAQVLQNLQARQTAKQ